MNSNLEFIDLFAGAGGLSEGLSEAGFHSLFANEVKSSYALTYSKNHVGTHQCARQKHVRPKESSVQRVS